MSVKTYDEKCSWLARDFLAETDGVTIKSQEELDTHTDALARKIQGAIEDYLEAEFTRGDPA